VRVCTEPGPTGTCFLVFLPLEPGSGWQTPC
jgi:hypothetical protein